MSRYYKYGNTPKEVATCPPTKMNAAQLEQHKMVYHFVEDANAEGIKLHSTERKICKIILDVWRDNKGALDLVAAKSTELMEFKLWVSFIMSYGYEADTILGFAKANGIVYDPEDCDPDDEFDVYGALAITDKVVTDLKNKYKM